MCTYETETLNLRGSGKGAQGWFSVTDASVYFDHPVHAPADHTLNLDFLNPALGPGARVALELDADSALALAEAIRSVVAAGRRSPQVAPAT
ncbi:MAG TPA: DUF6295 family protein [Candidatus Dormibacteraeota bacterium]|nr:DUF6295 family protein [Candidatus Dormibacteraeota bacterium]